MAETSKSFFFLHMEIKESSTNLQKTSNEILYKVCYCTPNTSNWNKILLSIYTNNPNNIRQIFVMSLNYQILFKPVLTKAKRHFVIGYC